MKMYCLWRGWQFGEGSMHYCTFARGMCVLSGSCFYSYVNEGNTALCICVCDCGCVCGANLCGACQNVLVVCSPSSRGTGDVHPRLSVPLLFKSQWDIQKLSAIRTGLCRGQVGFYCTAPTLSVCAWVPPSVSGHIIHLLQMLRCWLSNWSSYLPLI